MLLFNILLLRYRVEDIDVYVLIVRFMFMFMFIKFFIYDVVMMVIINGYHLEGMVMLLMCLGLCGFLLVRSSFYAWNGVRILNLLGRDGCYYYM